MMMNESMNDIEADHGTEMSVASGRVDAGKDTGDDIRESAGHDEDSQALKQTEFGLADLTIEDELEMEDDGSSSPDYQAEAAFEAPLNADALPSAAIEADGALLQNMQSIPEKMAFKIGEAAEMVGVKQYVLRYWETEFEMLRPRKSRNGQRVYSRRDVECAMMIKKLLYNDRFSIEGARVALRQLKTTVKSVVKEEKSVQVMARTQESAVMHMRGLLEEIRRIRQSI